MRKKFLLLLALLFLLVGVIFILPAVRDHAPDQTKESATEETESTTETESETPTETETESETETEETTEEETEVPETRWTVKRWRLILLLPLTRTICHRP